MSHSAAGRIPADPENVSPSNEAARLDRLGEPAPVDHLAVMYGKPAADRPWYPTSLRSTLLSEAAIGYSSTRASLSSIGQGNRRVCARGCGTAPRSMR
ncbi:hypothetical protein [Streptomyces sp. Wb2n-11]|uniref:hypothetical protein n=1 Tax=Streptomyces sp. Wb2n-11 TaxID=1030533 RepID=UPI000A45D8C0|nr:hypothetical protein [Streptomyces sp. Wb2n-11]